MNTIAIPELTALSHAGRAPEITDADDLYGWLVGSWELEIHNYWGDVRRTYKPKLISAGYWKAALCKMCGSFRVHPNGPNCLILGCFLTEPHFAFGTRKFVPGR